MCYISHLVEHIHRAVFHSKQVLIQHIAELNIFLHTTKIRQKGQHILLELCWKLKLFYNKDTNIHSRMVIEQNYFLQYKPRQDHCTLERIDYIGIPYLLPWGYILWTVPPQQSYINHKFSLSSNFSVLST